MKSDDRLAALHNLLSAPETHSRLDEILDELNLAVANIMHVERAAIRLLNEREMLTVSEGKTKRNAQAGNRSAPDIPGRRKSTLRGKSEEQELCSAILASSKIIGFACISGPQRKSCFDDDDCRLLGVIALLIGKSIEAQRLHGMLQSRFTQIALAKSSEISAGAAAMLVCQNPNQVAKILAKSFYREMRSAGFDVNQIINAATELVGQVSESLEKHKNRRRRETSEPPLKECAI